MKGYSGLRWVLLAPLLLVLTVCTSPPEPFRVGTNIWLGYEPLYLAQSMGYYDDLPIRMVTMNNATEVQRALRSGMLEAAALTLDEALSVKEDGFDIKVVLVMDFSRGADVLLSRPGIKSLADLRGKKVGVESSAVGAVLLHGALEAAGLTISDVSLVHLTIDQHQHAYETGEVDAVVTFEPVRTQLLNAGARVLFDSRLIPDRIVDVLVTRSDVSKRHGDMLAQLIDGHFSAVKYINDRPLEAAEKMTAREGISAKAIVAAYEGLHIPGLDDNRRLLKGESPDLAHSTRKLVDLMLKQGMLQKPVAVDGFFDNSWLPEN
ncbi:MAG: ABC transporter substrate-binding protein [Deltaproteobacteria bacterium]|nr:ABC transporter substrate-binding protein [Deltaproteobacteria bacterium]